LTTFTFQSYIKQGVALTGCNTTGPLSASKTILPPTLRVDKLVIRCDTYSCFMPVSWLSLRLVWLHAWTAWELVLLEASLPISWHVSIPRTAF